MSIDVTDRPDPSRRTDRFPGLALGSAALLTALLCCGPATPIDASSGDDAPGDGRGTDGPVLVELFTSQGCSSCPPADRLLTALGSDPKLANKVLPLAYHVDYWDYIGWTDPFSSEEWSTRQRTYAKARNSRRVYTPQLIVDGRADVVGSKKDEVYTLVRDALKRPNPAKLAVRISPGDDPKAMRATVTAEVLAAPAATAGHPLDLMVALYEKNLTTSVERGENASRTLHDDYVVRSLARAGEVASAEGARQEQAVTFQVEPSWKVRDLGIVAFLQDPETRAIYGSARATLAVTE